MEVLISMTTQAPIGLQLVMLVKQVFIDHNRIAEFRE
jgi:hypothetical protein